MEDVNTRLQISLPLSKLGGSPKESNSREIHPHSRTSHIHVMANRQLSKTEYPLTSMSRAQLSSERSRGFSKFTADQLLVFN